MLYCSTNAYSKTYTLNVSIGGYSGSTSFKFDASNYGGTSIPVTIYVPASFNVNGISQMSVWDSSSYSDKVFIKNTQYAYANYQLPSNCGAPSTVTLGGSSGNVYRVAGNSLTLAWSGAYAGTANAITGYYIYKNGSLYQTINSTATYGSVSVSAPSSGNYDTYYVKTRGAVSGYDSGNSTSRTVYAYTYVQSPDSVTLGNTEPDAGTNVTLRWSGAQSGGSYNAIDHYQVLRKATLEASFEVLQDNVSGTSLTVAAPSSMGSSYYYTVRAVGVMGDVASEIAFASMTAKVYTTDAPTNLNASPSPFLSGNLALSWTASTCTSGSSISKYYIQYHVKSYGGSYGAWTDLAESTYATYSYAPTLADGATIQYRIRALSNKGVYSSYAETSEVYHPYTPVAPSSVAATPSVWVSGNNIEVTWGESSVLGGSTISAYYIEYCKRTKTGVYGNWIALNNTAANVLTYTYTPTVLTAEGDHVKYRVRALSSDGVYSAYTEGGELSRGISPSAPTAFTATPESYDSGNVTLAWEGASDEDADIASYVIQYASSTNGSSWSDWYSCKTVESSATSGTTTDEPTMDRGSYRRYRIQTVDELGLTSGYIVSNSIYRVLGVIPPSALTPAGGVYETFGEVSWQASTTGDGEISGYDIQTSSDGGSTWSASVQQTGLTYDLSTVFNALSRGGSCCFRVRGRSTHETVSDWAVSGLYQKNRLPATPSITLPSGNATVYSETPYVFVSIAAEPDGNAYVIQAKKGSGDWADVSGQLNGAAVVAYDAPSSGTYSFRALDALGAAGQTASITITALGYEYTDASVEAGTTAVKAAHINDLRAVVNSLRAYYGLPSYSWDETVEAGTTSLRKFASHINELRSALATVLLTINSVGAGTLIPVPAWPSLSNMDVAPHAEWVTELRNICSRL